MKVISAGNVQISAGNIRSVFGESVPALCSEQIAGKSAGN